MEKILSGKPIAGAINKVSKALIAEHNLRPKMLLIQVGEDPASSYYVQSIITNAGKLGCEAELMSLPASAKESDLLSAIATANTDPAVHGIMIQKPLPKSFNDTMISQRVDPGKDLDAINPLNLGKIMMESDGFLPCSCGSLLYHEVLRHRSPRPEIGNPGTLERGGKTFGQYAAVEEDECHSDGVSQPYQGLGRDLP